jgi:hypothetical protein
MLGGYCLNVSFRQLSSFFMDCSALDEKTPPFSARAVEISSRSSGMNSGSDVMS